MLGGKPSNHRTLQTTHRGCTSPSASVLTQAEFAGSWKRLHLSGGTQRASFLQPGCDFGKPQRSKPPEFELDSTQPLVRAIGEWKREGESA